MTPVNRRDKRLDALAAASEPSPYRLIVAYQLPAPRFKFRTSPSRRRAGQQCHCPCPYLFIVLRRRARFKPGHYSHCPTRFEPGQHSLPARHPHRTVLVLESSSASHCNDVCKPVSVCGLLRVLRRSQQNSKPVSVCGLLGIENISPPSSHDTDTTSELLIYSPTLLTPPPPPPPVP